ncbi:flavin-binding monooxygenase-like protein [Aspergillus japonicus CBS 114.51]|uniref:Flavin-binding monooxygenase-like protein n=2 Tax=Aspergillus TaxID=5052 RepID=A0A2V5I1H2_ASPV1|nr:flavin-binding monooxygenase-like protein [Aspergillus japonicus CBS 114.51]PYI22360.1 flavin-binding monooxygenase-like protein [Aspergillus violaceofuscus CBS 115571]RAH85544.1 flavin-binding monooxygenase-like protein [Aspergillus japonicus CBS 114.51]
MTAASAQYLPGSVDIPVGKFPPTLTSTDVDPEGIASQLVDTINTALSKGDIEAISSLFLEDGYWRDHLCLTWDYRTAKGQERIQALLKSAQLPTKIEVDRSTALRTPHVGPIDAFGDVKGVEFFIKVSSPVISGTGVVRVAEVNSEWKIFTFFTSLQNLVGHEERVGHRRPLGAQHGATKDRRNWQDRRNAERNLEGEPPAVLIIGAGQAGLTVAARLKMLGVDSLIVDEADRVGDNWRKRYHQLVLHDPVWMDHLPYVPFPSSWPVFTPKDKFAEFLECYVKLLELNVWTRTSVQSTSWSEADGRWTIDLKRRKEDGSTETRTLQPRHVIQATGHSGKKEMPTFKGMETFRGDRLCHSSEFPGASDLTTSTTQTKKAVVVGACNSGHDIAQDYYEKGYDVTIVQRSSTCVISSASITDIGLKGLFDEDGPPTEDAEIYLWSLPWEVFKAQQIKITRVQTEHDRAVLDGLERAGFKVDDGPAGAGLIMKYFQRGGGYYIDVGASQLIADGKIKVKHGQEIAEILPHGLRFADGSELAADEIVLATGYQNMRTQARQIFGDAVADRVGDIWGMDAEGEMRTIWRRSGHPGLWFMGGNLALCRYFSRTLALQIKALEEGIPQ